MYPTVCWPIWLDVLRRKPAAYTAMEAKQEGPFTDAASEPASQDKCSSKKNKTTVMADVSTSAGSTAPLSSMDSDADSDMETMTSSKRSSTRSAWGKGPGFRRRKQERAAAHRARLGKDDGLTPEEYRLQQAEKAVFGGPRGTVALAFYNTMVATRGSVTLEVRMAEFLETMEAAQNTSLEDRNAVEQRVRERRSDGSLHCLLCDKQAWSDTDAHWSSQGHQSKISVHASLDALVGLPLKGFRPAAGMTGYRPVHGKLTQEGFIAFWGAATEMLGTKAREILEKFSTIQWKDSHTSSGKTKSAPASALLYARTGVVSYNGSSGRMSYSSQSYCRLAELPPHEVFEPSPHYPNMVLDSNDHGFWPVVEIGMKGADEETLAQQLEWAKQVEKPALGKSAGSKSTGKTTTDSRGEEVEGPAGLEGRLRKIGGVWVIVYCIHQLTWAQPMGWSIPLAPYVIDMEW